MNRLVHQGCVWTNVQSHGDGSLIACAGLPSLKRLAVSLGVMQVLQVAMNGFSLNTGACEKLNIGNYCCERCVCAVKGGKPAPQQLYASLFEDLTSVQN